MKSANIKETREVFEFLINTVHDIDKAREDDNRIDILEWSHIAMRNAPGALSAIKGINDIGSEVKSMGQDEMKEMAALGLKLALGILDLLGVYEREKTPDEAA